MATDLIEYYKFIKDEQYRELRNLLFKSPKTGATELLVDIIQKYNRYIDDKELISSRLNNREKIGYGLFEAATTGHKAELDKIKNKMEKLILATKTIINSGVLNQEQLATEAFSKLIINRDNELFTLISAAEKEAQKKEVNGILNHRFHHRRAYSCGTEVNIDLPRLASSILRT
jgi:hypothetical protein